MNLINSSPFAALLRRSLDESGRFTRTEWARFLTIPEEALEAWVNDQRLPSSHHLRIIFDCLELAKDVSPVYVAELRELAKRPANEVTPFASITGATLAAYLAEDLADYGVRLRGLSPEEQREALLTGGWGLAPTDNTAA